jgi:hypothetical protein
MNQFCLSEKKLDISSLNDQETPRTEYSVGVVMALRRLRRSEELVAAKVTKLLGILAHLILIAGESVQSLV